RKGALVDDADGAARRPGDGLDGHGQEANAECGMGNAECKWKTEHQNEPHPAIPHSAFRIPHSVLAPIRDRTRTTQSFTYMAASHERAGAECEARAAGRAVAH